MQPSRLRSVASTETQSFAQIAGYRYASRGMNLTGEGEPEQLAVTHATSNLFPLLGVKTIAGRAFVEAEDKLGTAAVALISHRLWQRRFDGDPHMPGKPPFVSAVD